MKRFYEKFLSKIFDIFHPVVPGKDGVCDCGSTKFYEGPSGGASVNLICAKCESVWYGCPIGNGVWLGWEKVRNHPNEFPGDPVITDTVKRNLPEITK